MELEQCQQGGSNPLECVQQQQLLQLLLLGVGEGVLVGIAGWLGLEMVVEVIGEMGWICRLDLGQRSKGECASVCTHVCVPDHLGIEIIFVSNKLTRTKEQACPPSSRHNNTHSLTQTLWLRAQVTHAPQQPAQTTAGTSTLIA